MPVLTTTPILKNSKREEWNILITFVCKANPKISFILQMFMSFVQEPRLVQYGKCYWAFAEEVRGGKRLVHAECIVCKCKAFYEWVEEQAAIILGMLSPGHHVEKNRTSDRLPILHLSTLFAFGISKYHFCLPSLVLKDTATAQDHTGLSDTKSTTGFGYGHFVHPHKISFM